MELTKETVIKNSREELIESIANNTKYLEEKVQSTDKALFSKLIGKLNKEFYGMNLTELSKYFKDNGICVRNNKVKNNFDKVHLLFQIYLIFKLRKEIKTNNPQTDSDYYRLATISAEATKRYFEEVYEQSPLQHLENLQDRQLDITNVVLTPNDTKGNYQLKSGETITTNTLKLETNEEREKVFEDLELAKDNLCIALSKINCVRSPKGFAKNLYEKLIVGVYKTKNVKTIIDLKNKLNKNLNTQIDTIEEILPTSHLKIITTTLNDLSKHVEYKQGKTNNQTTYNIFDYNHSLVTKTKESIRQNIKETTPEAKQTTPYMDVKRHIKQMK